MIDCQRWRPTWCDIRSTQSLQAVRLRGTLALKAATSTIPIVFVTGADP